MGTSLKYYILFYTFLFLFTFSASNDQTRPETQQARDHYSSSATAQYQVFYVKNTTPFLLDHQRRQAKTRSNKRAAVRGGKRNKNSPSAAATSKKFKNGPFSVMLPKGFVPPSGSSPCHNDNPNSVVFFCDLPKP